MPPVDKEPTPEREQTNESLRAEREKADDALGDKLAAIEEIADAVIIKARARADEVLALARAKTDREIRTTDVESSRKTARARAQEDEALRGERADADDTLRAERGEHVAVLSVERHETDKDLVSERARSDDAVATRDEFLGAVSHELRNMLASMVGFAGLIAKAVSKEDHVDHVLMHAERIQRSGARMNRLIGDLVDVASIEAGVLAVSREVGDPAHVVTEAVDSFQARAAESGVSLVLDIVQPASPAAFDPARILQVLTNLLGNAMKFTPPSGRIVVRVERIADDLRFSVSDTGVGICSEDLDAVFERFHQVTTKDRHGVRLGLYISKCIVQGHGGRIWAESRIGEGSTFSFTLPIHVAAEGS
jgi:signal transduction histidine kinase